MPMFRKSLLVLLVLAVAALGGTMYGLSQQDGAIVLDEGSAQTETGARGRASVTVYVTGAVNKPGVVTLTEGARLVDAVNACGGVLPTGDGSRVNMAQALKDGQKINVPEKAQAAGKQKAAAGAAGGETQLVNINTADVQALDSLPGVGPSTAQKIIDYRESEGGFQDISDLKKIKGIGEAKYAKLKDKVCI